MKAFSINVGEPPVSGRRKIDAGGNEPPQKCLSFSFRYWRQIDNFGFSGAGLEIKWFVSLLEQLQNLSAEFVDDIRRGGNSHKVERLRYHDVNWSQKNIPIARTDLNWLPKDVLENEEEFSFYQFQISMGTGRFMGFWDALDVFNIVLLDPMHNLQPSKDYNYKVDPCYPQRGQYQEAAFLIDAFREDVAGECELGAGCHTINKLRTTLNGGGGSFVVSLPPDQWQAASALIREGKISCVDDLWAFALLMAEEHPEYL
ncbi:MAG: hypothetical protein EOP06_18260 [Proteobacteria bacterium]|nr:MAG: hypothetical protein EOP06_18260 [Pseudomonadota bacterium]